MWLYFFIIKNQQKSVFYIGSNAYSSFYKNKAPKTSSTTFNGAIYCITFNFKVVQFNFSATYFIIILYKFKNKTTQDKVGRHQKLEPFCFAKLL